MMDPKVELMATALGYLRETRALVADQVRALHAEPGDKHLELSAASYADLTGAEYVADFLLPNFYFHLVTSHAILRSVGAPLGKRDYMLHLLPKVKQSAI